MTTTEILKKQLLSGMKVNKFSFLTDTNSLALTQRIHDLQNEGWNIRRKSIKGKGTLREYWLDQEEIERLKA